MVDDELEVTWTTAKQMLDSFWVNLTDDYGVMRRQLNVFFYPPAIRDALGTDHGVEVIDRHEGWDYPEGDVEVEIRGSSVIATFPGEVIDSPDGSPPYYWYAAIGDDEVDLADDRVDTCPDPDEGDDWPIPPPGPIPPQD